MKVTLPVLGLFLVLMSVQSAFAQAGPQGPGKTGNASPEQEVITLSKDKWQWMAERNVEALDKLLAEEAVFVRMGATMNKSQELDTIKSGRIQLAEPPGCRRRLVLDRGGLQRRHGRSRSRQTGRGRSRPRPPSTRSYK